MKTFKRALLATAVAALLSLPGWVALAQSGGGYDLSWNTIDSGGRSTGGNYELVGAIGQADAGKTAGGAYALSGGFLTEVIYRAYMPIVRNQ